MKSSHYIQIQPERDVTGDNFSKGEINLNWTMGSSGYFNLYKSYIKIRFKLFKRVSSADASLELSDLIGPNMLLCDNLFQTLKFHINNVCISEIPDYVPQVSMLKYRMHYSEEYLNNYLADTNYSQAYLEERQCQVIAEDHNLEDYLISSPQAGTVGVSTAGVVALSVPNTNLAVGDIIVLDTGAEIPIFTKTSTTDFGGPATSPAIVGASGGTWVYKTPRTRNNILFNNVQECRDVRIFEAIWRPCLGVFDIDEYIPGCGGLFNLRLTPQPNNIFQRCAIENGTGSNIDAGSASDANNSYVFEIDSLNMYLMQGIGEPVMNKALTLQMRETRCQSQNITTNSIHQKTFQVHPRTQELTLSYQFAGASIQNNAFSASKFVCNGDDELKIRRFWINFGTKQLPQPIPDTEFNRTSKLDYLVQRYKESLEYANGPKSPEPLRKWLERGIYFHFSGYSSSEKEDRCYISQQFDSFADNNIKPNVLLFDHYIKKVAIYIENSRLSNVQVM